MNEPLRPVDELPVPADSDRDAATGRSADQSAKKVARPAHAHADRNLLFGILALQMDCIDRDQLVAAMNAWVIDKGRPIERILRDQGALDAEALAVLEPMVALQLRRHGGDAARSLAAIGSATTAREAVAKVTDPDVQASLVHLAAPAAPPGTAGEATPADASGETTATFTVGTPTSAGTRFRILRPHAKGGLGEVYVARDEELGRQVALKEIQADKRDDPGLRSRFLLEAEINGNLEHPGIVPVYGLGTHADGRPFYAMRFIQGDSLKEAIADFHRAAPGLDATAYNLRLRHLLGRFLDVCDAIAFAHSRGVLHRDLKPANIMLGQYGETLIIDWGLAKATGRRDADAERSTEPTLVPSSGSGVEPTVAGSAIGTPGYMSPEQAEGRLEDLGPATDVYGLGATLYALLTSRAPVVGTDVVEILTKVRRGAIDPPRSVAPRVPPALAAICLKAMATRPEDRHPRCRALADDLEHWLADEPVSAYREPFPARVGRWMRRHRTLVTTAAALFLTVATVGVGLGLWLAEQHRARMVQLERFHASAAAQEALALKEPTRADRWDTALAAAQQAADGVGRDAASEPGRRILALRARVEAASRAARADAALLAELTSVRTALHDLLEAGVDAGYSAAFAAYGLDLKTTPPDQAIARLRKRPAGFVTEVVAMLDDWISIRRRKDVDRARLEPLVTLAVALDPDPQRERFRRLLLEPKLAPRVDELRRLAGDGRVAGMAPPTAVLLARSLIEAGDRGAAIEVLSDTATRHPQDVWANYDLANAFNDARPQRRADAIRFFTAARVLRPETAHTLAHLVDRGTHSRSETTLIFADLVRLRPEDGGHLGCYGDHLLMIGHPDEAAPFLDRAIALCRKALLLDPDEADNHNDLGVALAAKGKLEEAIAEYREALRIDPGDDRFYTNLANALDAKGDHEGAIVALREALRIAPGYAIYYYNLGNFLEHKGDLKGAIAEYREALRIAPDLTQAHTNLGIALSKAGDLKGAIAEYREALRIDANVVETHNNLSAALVDAGDPQGAIAESREALRIDPLYAPVYIFLGNALKAAGDLDGAIAASREAIRLRPSYDSARFNLGLALEARGDYDGAIAAYREAIRLRPHDEKPHNNLGNALRSKGDLEGALAEYHEALRINPEYALAHTNLGGALQAKGDLEGAIVECREALRIDPNAAEAHTNLGGALKAKGDLEGAIAEYREALRINPGLVEAHRNLGSALKAKGDREGAIAEYRAAIRLKPENAGAHTDLGGALIAKGDLEGAIAEHREAVRIDPDDAKAHTSLGSALQAKGDLKGAIAEFREVVRIKPGDTIAQFLLSSVLSAAGDREGAIAPFREAVRLQPDNVGAHNNLGVALMAKGDHDGAITEYRAAIRLKPDNAVFHTSLATALEARGDHDGAITESRTAIRLKPDDPAAHTILCKALKAKGELEGAIEEYLQAVRVDPNDAKAHTSLGFALKAKGDLEGAIAPFREAVRIEPDSVTAHTNLGVALKAKGDLEGAIAEFREVLRIKPGDPSAQYFLRNALDPVAHVNLASALKAKGDLDGAITEYRTAIRLKPDDAAAHNNLGVALGAKGEGDAAIAEYREAIRLDPANALAHTNLSNALRGLGDLEGAIAAYREVIRLKPDDSAAHFNLGLALETQGDHDRAIAAYRTSIRLKPAAVTHNNLGVSLSNKGERDAAIDEYRAAIRLNPGYALAHKNLGVSLMRRGEYAAARDALVRARDLSARSPDQAKLAEQSLREVESLIKLEGQLPVVLRDGSSSRDAGERLQFIRLLRDKGLYAAAAEFFGDAFSAQPGLADDPRNAHRYNAACVAALAGKGQAKDDPPPDEAARARLRGRALAWLRDDLAAKSKRAWEGTPSARDGVRKQVRNWKSDPDLAGLREEAELSKLNEAERKACRELWARVDGMLLDLEFPADPFVR